MPEQEQSIQLPGIDKETILSVCYSSFKQLNWDIRLAGDDKMLATTTPTWRGKSEQILITAAGNQLTISSKMTGGEMLDLGGKNKKNIDRFLQVFESLQNTLPLSTIELNLDAIHALKRETVTTATEAQVRAAELDKAMNLSGSNLYATYAIIAVNIIVFLLMALDGAGIMEPNGLVHLKWGSNFGPLTLSGDWWRLISNTFIHFGLIHIGMNMYCLYIIGAYLERMLGKIRYVAAYLCTGVLASLTSLWWHTTPANSAGASGAVFGMYGLFLAFLTTNLIPELARKSLLKSIGLFIVYNLAFGAAGSIDNSAHIGGLVSGFIIGYLYVFSIKKEKQDLSVKWDAPLIVLITVAIAFAYLQQHKGSLEERQAILEELKSAQFKDK